MPHLDLTDEEAAALNPRASRHRRERPLPFLAAHPHAEGHSRQAQTRTGPQAPAAAAEGLCAAVERQIRATARLVEQWRALNPM
jgi:hypothetical protein